MTKLESNPKLNSRWFFEPSLTAFMKWMGVLMIAWPGTASAHPGHHLQDASWSHLLLSPDHLLLLLVLGMTLGLLGHWAQRRRVRRVLRGVGITLAFVSLALFSLRF